MSKYHKRLMLGASVLAAALVSGPAAAEMSCTVAISSTELGFIVTVGGGSGKLRCDGDEYSLRIGGLTLGGLGMSGLEATGTVHGLEKVEDFAGTYSGGSASVTAIAGVAALSVTNEKGVRLELQGSTAGADLKLGAGGMKISFE